MNGTLKPEYLKRYKDLVTLFIKYGRSDLVRGLEVQGVELPEEGPAADGRPADPVELTDTLEKLGPTYIKLGQLLSTRPDLVSDRYIQALSRLQDEIEPFPPEQARQIIEDELGVRISKAFPVFQDEPIAAASLAQVHYAQLRDGREVAIKVQRPGIRKIIADDLDAFGEVAAFIDTHTDFGRKYRILDMLEDFRMTLFNELDFRREAANLVRLGEITADYPELVVPQPIADFTTSQVLTMDFIKGVKIQELNPVVKLDYDRSALAEALSKAYLDQILVHGFLHADPHPGNVLLTPDGRLALIDLGMVAYLSPTRRDQIIKLLLAINDGKPEEAASTLSEIGTPTEESDNDRFVMLATQIIQQNQNSTLSDMPFGQIVMELTRAGADNGISPAPELTMLGKALLSLDQVTTSLDPDFNPERAIGEHIRSIVRARMMQSLSPGSLLSTVMELYTLLQKLPERVNHLFERLSNQEFEIKVNAFDEDKLMANLQKIANRIALALVLAALIVGAAQLSRIPSSFNILGYPAVATFMFILAAVMGFYLVIRIFLEDSSKK